MTLAKRGVKRSVLVEGNAVPLGVAVDGANRNDFKMARATLESIPIDRPKPTQEAPSICAWIKATTMTKYGSWGRNLAIPCRFDPEMKKYRRSIGKSDQSQALGGGTDAELDEPLSQRADPALDKKVENYLGLLHLACALITYRATGLLGLNPQSLRRVQSCQ